MWQDFLDLLTVLRKTQLSCPWKITEALAMASGPNNQRFSTHYVEPNYNNPLFHYYHHHHQPNNNMPPPQPRYHHHHQHNNTGRHNNPPGANNSSNSSNNNNHITTGSGGGSANKESSGTLEYTGPTHSQTLLEQLWKLCEEGKLCDVELVVGEKEFPCHRAVLAAASPYFDAMFSSNMVEGSQRSITLPDIDPTYFGLIFKFIYTGKITLTRENVQEVMAIAHQLRIQEILDVCCNFLLEELHPSNCVGIYRFAEMYSCTNLKVKAKIYVERHFSDIVEEEEFTELPKDLLKGFLKSEGLSILNEYQLLQAMVRWVLHNVKDRIDFLPELLESIRLPIISTRLLDNLASQCTDPKVQEILLQKFEEHKCLMQEPQEDELDVRSKPRIGVQQSLYVVGGYHRKPDNPGHFLNSVECWPFHKGTWQQLPHMKFARRGHGMGMIDGLLYVVGGEMASKILDSCEVYDPSSNCWSTIRSMSHPRSMLGACVLQRQLYILGGWDGRDVDASIERYDPVSDLWTYEGTMKCPRFAMGVVAHENKIYLAGGLDQHSEPQRRVEAYCPETQTWELLSPMNQPRAYFSLAPLHGLLYAVGGVSYGPQALHTVERFSPEENKWTPVSSLKHGRAGAGATVYNGALYVVGGHCHQDRSTVTLIDIYYPETNSWWRSRDFFLNKSRCDATVMIF